MGQTWVKGSASGDLCVSSTSWAPNASYLQLPFTKSAWISWMQFYLVSKPRLIMPLVPAGSFRDCPLPFVQHLAGKRVKTMTFHLHHVSVFNLIFCFIQQLWAESCSASQIIFTQMASFSSMVWMLTAKTKIKVVSYGAFHTFLYFCKSLLHKLDR